LLDQNYFIWYLTDNKFFIFQWKISQLIGKNQMIQQEKYDRYAIFATGGKQYQAIEGATLSIEKIDGEAGKVLEFDQVLFRKLGEGSYEIGQPFLTGSITASIIKQIKDPKVIVFKFKRRQKVRVKKGHRQPKTVVRIETI
jgi:large subunit ribosomal protein L21